MAPMRASQVFNLRPAGDMLMVLEGSVPILRVDLSRSILSSHDEVQLNVQKENSTISETFCK